MKHLPLTSLITLCIPALVISGCSSSGKYPHELVNRGEVLGVYALIDRDGKQFSLYQSFETLATRNNSEEIIDKLDQLSIEKLVLRYLLQSFPPRTQVQVIPVRESQVKLDTKSTGVIDIVQTGKALSIDYMLILKIDPALKTTGFHYREKWRPQMRVVAEMTRISDNKLLMRKSLDVRAKPFDKYTDARLLDKNLETSFTNLASEVVDIFARSVGPVIRKVPEKEKIVQQKIYDYSHIRAMADKNNCVITGDLKKEITKRFVVYHVPCRDMVLTYACDGDADGSRCWLQ